MVDVTRGVALLKEYSCYIANADFLGHRILSLKRVPLPPLDTSSKKEPILLGYMMIHTMKAH